jgi:hypothetical protein
MFWYFFFLREKRKGEGEIKTSVMGRIIYWLPLACPLLGIELKPRQVP